jgi:hypothetical protein
MEIEDSHPWNSPVLKYSSLRRNGKVLKFKKKTKIPSPFPS